MVLSRIVVQTSNFSCAEPNVNELKQRAFDLLK